MVIAFKFRVGQHWDGDHREYTPQFKTRDRPLNVYLINFKKVYWRKHGKFQHFNGSTLIKTSKKCFSVAAGHKVAFNEFEKFFIDLITRFFLWFEHEFSHWTKWKVVELIEDPNLFKIMIDDQVLGHLFTNDYSKYTILNFLQHPGVDEYKRTRKVSFIPCKWSKFFLYL